MSLKFQCVHFQFGVDVIITIDVLECVNLVQVIGNYFLYTEALTKLSKIYHYHKPQGSFPLSRRSLCEQLNITFPKRYYKCKTQSCV